MVGSDKISQGYTSGDDIPVEERDTGVWHIA